ncbi:MAG TPA: hypothetical protein VKD04_13285 [Burkholderiales bacterium]|nr:hypothetical protein [Burkholderiales bacterium]
MPAPSGKPVCRLHYVEFEATFFRANLDKNNLMHANRQHHASSLILACTGLAGLSARRGEPAAGLEHLSFVSSILVAIAGTRRAVTYSSAHFQSSLR